MPRSELTTKDGKSLEDMLQKARTAIDIYRDAERPFRDLFATEVNQQTFFQEVEQDDIYWDKIAEGEHPRTVVDDDEKGKWITIRGDTYSKSLGFTRKFIQNSTSEEIMRKIQRMLEGAANTEDRLVRNAIFNHVADGSGTWYDIPDFGEYSHSNDHNHVFATTGDLFDDTNAHEPHEHLETAKDHLTHHGFEGPFVALMSTSFKRKLRDELSWDAQFHIPMANNMRSSDLGDLDIVIDNIRAVETPWMTGNEVYVTQVDNEGPVKFYPEEEVTVTRPNGANVESPGDLLGANGYARMGVRPVDPLRTVNFTADNLA